MTAAPSPEPGVAAPVAAQCPVHPGYPAAGTCQRCGRFYCVRCVPDAAARSAVTCPECVVQHPQKPLSALAVTGLVLSLVGICMPILFLVGLVISIIAVARTGEDAPIRGRGLAIAGVCVSVGVAGLLTLIAVPNFFAFQKRSKQAECKTNLKMLYALQQSFRGEYGHYAPTFDEALFAPDRGNRYAYLLQPGGPLELRNQQARVAVPGATRIGADEFKHEELSTTRLLNRQFSLLATPAPGVSADSFVAACVGNLDDDEDVDVWSVASFDRYTGDGEHVPEGTPFNDARD